MINLSIVLPCYNEGDNIWNIADSIEKSIVNRNDVEIIFVDNGSTDSTQQVLNELINKARSTYFKSLRIEKNIGYGHGIMEGVRIARGEVIAWTHADLQTDPGDVLEAYESYKIHSDYPKCILKGRRVGRNIIDTIFTSGMSVIATLLLKSRLSDINAQPKMFHRSFLEKLNETPLDFSLDLYFLFKAKIDDYPIIEHPVRFGKRLHGEAKGGGTIKGKWKLIKRTWSYMVNLKKSLGKN